MQFYSNQLSLNDVVAQQQQGCSAFLKRYIPFFPSEGLACATCSRSSQRLILARQDLANCIYIRQPAALGLGHAVLCARPVVGDEPFAVLLADDFMDVPTGTAPVLAQMTAAFEKENVSILAVQNVPAEMTRQYGVVSATAYRNDLELVSGIVESRRRSGRRPRWPWLAVISWRRVFSRSLLHWMPGPGGKSS